MEKWLQQYPEDFQVDAVDTINDNWKKADFINMMLFIM